MNEYVTVNTILMSMLAALAGAVTLILPFLAKFVIAWLQAKTQREESIDAHEQLDRAVANATKIVEQTGANNDSTTKRRTAIMTSKTFLGPKGTEIVQKIYGVQSEVALDTLIGDKVEAAVHDMMAPAVGAADVAALAGAKAINEATKTDSSIQDPPVVK